MHEPKVSPRKISLHLNQQSATALNLTAQTSENQLAEIPKPALNLQTDGSRGAFSPRSPRDAAAAQAYLSPTSPALPRLANLQGYAAAAPKITLTSPASRNQLNNLHTI